MILTIISHGQIRTSHRNRTLRDRALRRDPADFGGFAIGSDKHIVCSETAVRSISERDEEICGNCSIVSCCICRFVAIGIQIRSVGCLVSDRFRDAIDGDTVNRAGKVSSMCGAAIVNLGHRTEVNGDRLPGNIADGGECFRREGVVCRIRKFAVRERNTSNIDRLILTGIGIPICPGAGGGDGFTGSHIIDGQPAGLIGGQNICGAVINFGDICCGDGHIQHTLINHERGDHGSVPGIEVRHIDVIAFRILFVCFCGLDHKGVGVRTGIDMSGLTVTARKSSRHCFPGHIQIQGLGSPVCQIDNDGFFFFHQIQRITVSIGFGEILDRDMSKALDREGAGFVFDFKERIIRSRGQHRTVFQCQSQIGNIDLILSDLRQDKVFITVPGKDEVVHHCTGDRDATVSQCPIRQIANFGLAEAAFLVIRRTIALGDRDPQFCSDRTHRVHIKPELILRIGTIVTQLVLRDHTVFAVNQSAGICRQMECVGSDRVSDRVIGIAAEDRIEGVLIADIGIGIRRQDRIVIGTGGTDGGRDGVGKACGLEVVGVEVRFSVSDHDRVFNREQPFPGVVDRTAVECVVFGKGTVGDRGCTGTVVHNIDTAAQRIRGIFIECAVVDTERRVIIQSNDDRTATVDRNGMVALKGGIGDGCDLITGHFQGNRTAVNSGFVRLEVRIVYSQFHIAAPDRSTVFQRFVIDEGNIIRRQCGILSIEDRRKADSAVCGSGKDQVGKFHIDRIVAEISKVECSPGDIRRGRNGYIRHTVIVRIAIDIQVKITAQDTCLDTAHKTVCSKRTDRHRCDIIRKGDHIFAQSFHVSIDNRHCFTQTGQPVRIIHHIRAGRNNDRAAGGFNREGSRSECNIVIDCIIAAVLCQNLVTVDRIASCRCTGNTAQFDGIAIDKHAIGQFVGQSGFRLTFKHTHIIHNNGDRSCYDISIGGRLVSSRCKNVVAKRFATQRQTGEVHRLAGTRIGIRKCAGCRDSQRVTVNDAAEGCTAEVQRGGGVAVVDLIRGGNAVDRNHSLIDRQGLRGGGISIVAVGSGAFRTCGVVACIFKDNAITEVHGHINLRAVDISIICFDRAGLIRSVVGVGRFRFPIQRHIHSRDIGGGFRLVATRRKTVVTGRFPPSVRPERFTVLPVPALASANAPVAVTVSVSPSTIPPKVTPLKFSAAVVLPS